MFHQGAEMIHPVIDCGVQTGVAVGVLNLVPVWKLQWWWGDLTRKMRLVTYGCTDQLFKMWCVIPVTSLQQSPIISANDLIIQSEQALFTPLQIQRTKGQTEGKAGCFFFLFFFTTSPQETIDHSLLLLEYYWVGSWGNSPHSYTICFFSTCLSWNDGVEKMFHQLKLKKTWPFWENLPPDKNVLTEKQKTGKLGFINGNHCASLHFLCSNDCHPDWMQTVPWIVCQMGSTSGAIGLLELIDHRK